MTEKEATFVEHLVQTGRKIERVDPEKNRDIAYYYNGFWEGFVAATKLAGLNSKRIQQQALAILDAEDTKREKSQG